MKDFFENAVVATWIAPIITGIIVIIITTLFGKLIAIWWKNRTFVRKVERANEKYIENILPYMIQEIVIDNKILDSIKKAISLEYKIPEKYLYTNEQICNLIILNISTTRFLTEFNKARLIDSVLQVFEKIGQSTYVEEEKNAKVKTNKIYPFLCFAFSMALSIILYISSPEKVDDPNSLAQVLFVLGILISMTSILFLWVSILAEIENKVSINIEDYGIVGSVYSAFSAFSRTLTEILFGKRKR